MIDRASLETLSPQQRARLIYADAKNELAQRLWKAALGDGETKDEPRSIPGMPRSMNSESLLSLLAEQGARPGATPAAGCACQCDCACHKGSARKAPTTATPASIAEIAVSSPELETPVAQASVDPDNATPKGLGPNARFSELIADAARRSGIPSNAIAAIVDAEAGKHRDGSWNTHSRNPRSSAAGLGQFLSGTWQDMAQTAGTWLNDTARARGWLDSAGRVAPAARSELLALRYDAGASIRTVADFARKNLDRLERTGVPVRETEETVARAAYLAHHLGLGDAQRFLKGGLVADRARELLRAQIGGAAAEQRIAQAGNATIAHREWLLGYIDRNIRPNRFG